MYVSFASMLSTLSHRALPTVATCAHRLREGTTSAAVISLPLWNLTPLRSVMVWRKPRSLIVCDSARCGTGVQPRSWVKSVS